MRKFPFFSRRENYRKKLDLLLYYPSGQIHSRTGTKLRLSLFWLPAERAATVFYPLLALGGAWLWQGGLRF